MPTFSEITIEFLVDFEDDYQLGITYKNGETITSNLFTWVASRSAAFEVTTGTPTATAGETTAINFETAFDLDNPTGYITTQTTNEIQIQSETEGEDFIGVRVSDENGDGLINGEDFVVTFSNYVAPIDNSNIEFALVRSPHYVNIPFDFNTTTSASLSLYVWDGDLNVLPSEVTYQLTFPRPSTNFSEFNVDLSQLIAEQIEAVPTIDLSSTTQIVDSTSDSVKWIRYTASYTDPTETIADIEGTFVAVDGYGYYAEGVNPTKPSNNVLTDVYAKRKVSRDGFILFPFVNNGSITSIDIDSKTGQINETEVITATDLSTNVVQYLEIDVSQASTDTSITITTAPDADTFRYEIVDECRYTPKQVIFKNKYGVYECLTLFKKNSERLSIQSDEFVNNYVNAGAYNSTVHQFKKLNVTATESISVNSGYINEAENELYKQLLVSDKVYFYENNALVPIKVKTSNLAFKTRVNDRLVNYEIEFDYAYNIIQNV